MNLFFMQQLMQVERYISANFYRWTMKESVDVDVENTLKPFLQENVTIAVTMLEVK